MNIRGTNVCLKHYHVTEDNWDDAENYLRRNIVLISLFLNRKVYLPVAFIIDNETETTKSLARVNTVRMRRNIKGSTLK